ncbi:hypothetical protein BBI11_12765 [Planococcus maritimus]|uniref:hypothetical protein n=1 Tax=Planococcus maritimus TaxID=192421 RepID=UPI00080F06BF|nr:hypothetical protein [Planococcus maritimus]ANU17851.1 hypothetical protein BBI11_12765 [Planococcus maritimus]
MKEKVWKVAGGSFLITFILLFWLGDRTIMTTDVNGMSSPALLSDSDYFLKTVSYSLVITLVVVLAFYLINWIQKKNKQQTS